jgi:precorrin-2 dehydrogenase / sirohydrochlorin ferrochelatase
LLPLALDLSAWPVLLVGDGPAALKRLDMLEEAGAQALRVFAEAPSPALRARAGARLTPRLPSEAEVAAARLLFVAGVPADVSGRLAAAARTTACWSMSRTCRSSATPSPSRWSAAAIS